MRIHHVIATKNVPHANAHMLSIFKTVKDRQQIDGAFAHFSHILDQPFFGRQPIHLQCVDKLVDHAGIAFKNFDQIVTRCAKSDVETERWRVVAEQLPQNAFGTQTITNSGQLEQRDIRVGCFGQLGQQRWSNRSQKMLTPPRRQKLRPLACQLHQVGQRPVDVLEPIGLQHFVDHGRIGIGIENQIDLWGNLILIKLRTTLIVIH